MNKDPIAQSSFVWQGQSYDVSYFEADNFDFLPIQRCRQIYGVCYYDNKIILAKRFDGIWTLPGGGVKVGETFEEALKREVEEESNMEILEYYPIGYQHVTGDDEDVYQLRALCKVSPIGKFVSDPDGDIEAVKLIKPKDFTRYIDWGGIGNALIEGAQIKIAELENLSA